MILVHKNKLINTFSKNVKENKKEN